ncbi:MAG: hypothetical protein EOP06_31960 [Proteobacteria bacterium]|nr:MAG: hypothetical protein EOP06_31960 [Pseudomonadota bacterium]
MSVKPWELGDELWELDNKLWEFTLKFTPKYNYKYKGSNTLEACAAKFFYKSSVNVGPDQHRTFRFPESPKTAVIYNLRLDI